MNHENSFRAWMEHYPDHKYKDTTINMYIRALKRADLWFGITLDKPLLEIGKVSELDKALHEIKSVRNFDEIDLKHGHNSFTAASVAYAKYLNSGVNFEWIDFYTKFADTLLLFIDRRPELISKIVNVYDNLEMKLPKMENTDVLIDIDPFTIFGMFNKHMSDMNRIKLIEELCKEFEIDAVIPSDFSGIPVLNNLKANFYMFQDSRGENDIANLWELFESALVYAENKSSVNQEEEFIKMFDTVLQQQGIRWNITMGLYWIRPYNYINLDSRNRKFLTDPQYMPKNFIASLPNLNNVPSGTEYLYMCEQCKSVINSEELPFTNFPELSAYAWKVTKNDDPEDDPEVIPMDIVREANPLVLNNKSTEKYTKSKFLEEVYMSENRYDSLAALLKNKKNLILQGAPGVGKTFAARRLAYSLMGEKDESRIEMIQFHQNYSYEDFMMGYKPTEDGFELKYGIFYRFCTLAANHPDKPYFFIIDEINRGNMSKIFGELLMLIEKDYRGTKATLAYNGMSFSVPENLYIIGMMNTADRSLAMIDYALRRRFSFFEMEPAFESESFASYAAGLKNDVFTALVEQIIILNKEIEQDKSLGRGFCIGHSYFCNKNENDCDALWLMSVVEYEILPMLAEYWFDEPSKLNRWEANLRGVFQ